MLEKRLIDVAKLKADITKNLEMHGFVLTHEPLSRITDERLRNQLLKFIIAGSFYPNYFIQERLNFNEVQHNCFGLNPFSTVTLQGFPINGQEYYKQWVIDYAHNFGNIKSLRFDYSRCFITYTNDYNTDLKIPNAVFFAVKEK